MMSEPVVEKVGGIVLCGGRSRRMGRPKHTLPFGAQTMLVRVVGILQEVVSPVVVVAAAEQELPELSSEVIVARDEREGLGPLEGLAVGLEALDGRAEAAYVSSCDVPLLKPAFVRRMIALLGHHELAVPREGKYHHPLAAVYRTALVEKVRGLIVAGRMRPYFLVEECYAQIVEVAELRSVDERLESLRNLNTPEEYRAALRAAGLENGDDLG